MDGLREFIQNWNLLYPIDKWWRDKHKVPFGSRKHREQNMIDMRFEYEEDLMFLEIERDQLHKRIESQSYTPGTGNWIKKRKIKVSKDQIEHDFDRLDISGAREEVVDGKRRITL